VIAQVAMSLVLLSAAALLGRSLRNLEHQNFGFETEGRYIAWINPMLGNYKPEQLEPMFRKIDHRLSQIPGVRMVAPALYAPMTAIPHTRQEVVRHFQANTRGAGTRAGHDRLHRV
jgi:putative ABC transport system permease protein